jgi:hypothetical protein
VHTPGITEDDVFLGIFMVNTAHSIMHLASGAIFLTASISGAGAARLWFQLVGTVYAAMAVMGFKVSDGMIFGLISNNWNDSWGHAAMALVLLLVGFAIPTQTAPDKRPLLAIHRRCVGSLAGTKSSSAEKCVMTTQPPGE